MSFDGMGLVDAIQLILAHFQFPLNGQMADQILQTFSETFICQSTLKEQFSNLYSI
jgi:hypothetical protein